MRNLALLALALTTACATAPAPTSPRPDLDGTWLLDPSESNDSTVFALALADSADPRLRPRTDFYAARDSIYFPGSDPVRLARRALASLREPPQQVSISASDTLVQLRFDGTHDVALQTDGRARNDTLFDGETWELRARWTGGRLELRRRRAHGPEITDYLSRSPGSSTLVIWSVLTLYDERVTVRRVYQLADHHTPGSSR